MAANSAAKIQYSKLQSPLFTIWVTLIAIAICFGLLYYHVIVQLVHDWIINDNYSHGFLIPIISLYLIWQRKQEISRLEANPANWGIGILIMGLCLFVLGTVASEFFTMRFSMLIVIWGIIIFLLGYEYGKKLFVPVAYLTFMIPLPAIIWNKIAFPLKLFATKMAVGTISLLGMPVYREGNIINLSNTTLQVVDACSGMRSLASLLALSAAFAFITERSKKWKWVLFLSAIPIAIILNIIRLTLTAFLAQHYGAEAAQGFLHEMSGMLVFLIAILLLYVAHYLLPGPPKSHVEPQNFEHMENT